MKKILVLILTFPLFFSQNNHDNNHSHEEHAHENEFALGIHS